MSGEIRVVVVDDSAFVRKVVRQMLARSPFIDVVGTARDGEEALEIVGSLRPDVVTLDLSMPGMDGVEFLRRQMAVHPVPVVVCSITHESGMKAVEALEAGAVDFIQKPTALATDRVFEIAEELVGKVKAAAQVKFTPNEADGDGSASAITSRPIPLTTRGTTEVVVIGISTGGPQALRQMIPEFPGEFPLPIVIVLHMPVGYTAMYAYRLNEVSALTVVEAKSGEVISPGMVYVAPAGQHLTLSRGSDGQVRCRLDDRPTDTPHRPSVDVLFESAARAYGDKVMGVVMTGMGNDGMVGAGHIKANGGRVLTEAESSCVVYGMPRAVVEALASDRSVPLGDMASAIMEMI